MSTRVRRLAVAAYRLLCLALALAAGVVALPRDVEGQTWYASPELGWSDRRGAAVGARVGAEVVGGLDLVAQGLLFFPDESGIADPGVTVDRSAWQVSGNAIYLFDRTRALAPYVGAGIRFGSADLRVVVDGLRASRSESGFGTNLLGGVRLPRLPAAPFVEVRFGDETWTLTGGVALGW